MNVRDRWRIKLQKMNQCNSRLAREKFVRSNPRKGHVWSTWLETKESHQAVKFASVSWEGPSRKVLAKHIVWKKVKLLYQIPQLLPLHLYILERFIAQTLTTPDLSVEILVLLRSIGRSHLVANAIGLNCGIRKAREVKTPRSSLVVGAWRAQV